jgi:phosphoribosyl-AMP cyclohydrolase
VKVAGMSDDIETGSRLTPRYGADGLITAVVTDAADGAVLMVAHMNADALAATLDGGEAVFWSRSRQRLWRKGETSGHTLKVRDIRVDCDQDALWIIAEPAGPTCHTGARSCFYRRIGTGGSLEPIA